MSPDEGLVCCTAGEREFALRAADVRQILPAEQMRLAAGEDTLAGTLDLDGQAVPVFRLESILGRTASPQYVLDPVSCHIAVTGAIDDHVAIYVLAAGFVLDNHACDAVSLPDGVHNVRVEQDFDAGFLGQLNGENLPCMGVNADGRGAFGIENVGRSLALLLQAGDALGGESADHLTVPVVVEAQPAERGGDAAEKAAVFEENRFRAVSRGTDGSSNSGSTRSGDDHLLVDGVAHSTKKAIDTFTAYGTFGLQ